MLIAALVTGVMSVPLASNAALSQCTGTKMCVWGNNDFEWLIAAQNHGKDVVDAFNDAAGENNAADSWQNRSNTYSGCLYDGSNGSNHLQTMKKGSKDDNMLFLDADKASSMRTNGPC